MIKPPTLLHAFATVSSITMVSRITGFVRDIIIAATLGAGFATDAFLVAFQFPNLFRRFFAEGAFSAGFVPIFAEVVESNGIKEAQKFANQVLSLLALILLVFVILMMILMPFLIYVIAPGFAKFPGQIEKTVELARVTFPYLFFISIVSLQSGILNALTKFAAAAATPIILNLTLITSVLISLKFNKDEALFLAWGVCVSGALQVVWLMGHLRRNKVSLKFTYPMWNPRVLRLLKLILPVAFGASLYQLNLLIDKILATLVSSGAVSWLYFADRVNQLPIGVIGVGIGVVLLPVLVKSIHKGENEQALEAQERAVRISILLSIPACVGLLLLSNPIISTLFERGEFTVTDRLAASSALAAFACGLPAYILIKALVPGFFSRNDTLTPVKISAFAMALNIILNLILMSKFGHVGIAMATAISAWCNAGLLAVFLYKRKHFVINYNLVRCLICVLLSSLVMASAIVWGLQISTLINGPVFGLEGVPSGNQGARVLSLTGLIFFGIIAYSVSLFLSGGIGSNELKKIF
ncbi:MAG: murein biosynthesis integral membrane protein MurJ [Rhodospirillaceae bacterium]|nr:murein biosynthesis integral membrane protein MurJ [Rhodospirillaceae bacterium]